MTALEPALPPDCIYEREGLTLTPMQVGFVEEFVDNGGNARAAAKAAGYAASGADSYASKMLRNPQILKAIHLRCVMQLGRAVPKAIKAVTGLATNANSEYVKLQAAQDVLDRVGLSAPKRVDVSGGVSVQIDLS